MRIHEGKSAFLVQLWCYTTELRPCRARAVRAFGPRRPWTITCWTAYRVEFQDTFLKLRSWKKADRIDRISWTTKIIVHSGPPWSDLLPGTEHFQRILQQLGGNESKTWTFWISLAWVWLILDALMNKCRAEAWWTVMSMYWKSGIVRRTKHWQSLTAAHNREHRVTSSYRNSFGHSIDAACGQLFAGYEEARFSRFCPVTRWQVLFSFFFFWGGVPDSQQNQETKCAKG